MNRKLPALAVLVLLVLVSVSGWLAEGPSVPPEDGAGSSKGGGRLALARLLDAAGFPVERWERRPGALPRRPGLVWLERLPEGLEKSSEIDAHGEEPLRAALERGLANPQHYRRFAAGGGVVLVELREERQLMRLTSEFGLFELEHLRLVPPLEDGEQIRAPVPMLWTTGETLDLSEAGRGALLGRASLPQALVLLEDRDGRTVILEVPIGRGSVVLVACGEVWDNRRLAEHDHAVLAVRIAERAPRGTIFLDESHGWGGDAPTLLGLAGLPRALPFTVGMAILALLCLWRSLAAREIPRDAPPVEFLSARTRALARARLFQRARRYDLLADALRDGTLRRIGVQLGLPHQAAAQARSESEGALAWARLAGAPGDGARWAELLTARDVPDAAALARLAGDLRELETRLSSETTTQPRARSGSHARRRAVQDPASLH